MKKRNLGEGVFQICNGLVLLLVSLVTLYPFLYVIFASFSDPLKLMGNSSLLLKPLGFSLGAYKKVFLNPSIYSGYMNTVFYVTVGTLVNILATCMAAYVLSRKQFMLRRVLTIMFIFTMYFSGGLIPSYLLINNWLHLSNTIFALILPGAMSAYTVIIMRNFFESIPDSLEESAKLDGANDVTILFRIMVPLSKASIATIALWSIVYHWNEWFNCMLYMKDEDKYVLQYVLRKILLDGQTQDINMATNVVVNTETMKMATLVVSILPIIMLYPFLQKYFAKGVMVGSVKG